MNFSREMEIKREDSLEEYEFLDAEGDLDVDLSKSPIIGAGQNLTSGTGLLISTLCTVVEEKGLDVKIPFSAVAATAVGAVTGSLLAGPPGLAIGLFTGAILAYHHSPSRSKKPQGSPKTATKSTIRDVFNEMSVQQKMSLVKELLSCLKKPNIRSLVLEIVKNEEVRDMATEILANFLKKKTGISLIKPK